MTAAASSGIHGQETESLGDITITEEVEKMKDCVEKNSLIHADDDNMISYHKKCFHRCTLHENGMLLPSSIYI